MRLRWSIALALVVATFAVFFPVRNHEFLNYDDLVYLGKLRGGFDSETLRRVFTTALVDNWMPVTWISWLVDHELYGRSPAGFLLGNVALHAISSALLFFAFARMTGSAWSSAFVAAVFALHPLHVESVAWMSERKDVLSGLFFNATLLAYALFAERRTPGRYAVVAATLALGLMSKPTLVTLPFVLLLLDYWPLGRLRGDTERVLPDPARLGRAVLEKLPFFALAAGVSVVTLGMQRQRGYLADTLVFSVGERIANAVDSYGFYLAKSLWPSGLAVFYPHPGATLPLWRTAGVALLLLAATGATLRAASRRPYLAVGWLWFLGTLVPMIGLVQVGTQAAADRYMYLPLIGLSLLPAFGAAELFGRRRVVLAVVGAASVAALAGVASVQVHHWRDTTALFERAVAVTAENAMAHSNLGAAYQRARRYEDARVQLSEAVRIRPEWSKSRIRLADTLAAEKSWEQALPHYEQALQRDPHHSRARINYGQTLLALGRYEAARDQFERAAAGRAHLAAIYRVTLRRGLARTAWERGRPGEAVAHYRLALEARSGDPGAHAGLGVVLARMGRFDEARAHLDRARASSRPGSAEAIAVQAAAAATAGRDGEALRLYEQALLVRPDLPFAADHRAWILATTSDPRLGNPDDVIAETRAVIEAGRSNALRLDTLAAAYAAAGRYPEAVQTAEIAVRNATDLVVAEQIRARIAVYREGRPYRARPLPDGA